MEARVCTCLEKEGPCNKKKKQKNRNSTGNWSIGRQDVWDHQSTVMAIFSLTTSTELS